MLDILFKLGVIISVCSYIYLIYFYIKEKIYKDFGLFDGIIFILGPIGLLFVLIVGYFNYDDEEELNQD